MNDREEAGKAFLGGAAGERRDDDARLEHQHGLAVGAGGDRRALPGARPGPARATALPPPAGALGLRGALPRGHGDGGASSPHGGAPAAVGAGARARRDAGVPAERARASRRRHAARVRRSSTTPACASTSAGTRRACRRTTGRCSTSSSGRPPTRRPRRGRCLSACGRSPCRRRRAARGARSARARGRAMRPARWAALSRLSEQPGPAQRVVPGERVPVQAARVDGRSARRARGPAAAARATSASWSIRNRWRGASTCGQRPPQHAQAERARVGRGDHEHAARLEVAPPRRRRAPTAAARARARATRRSPGWAAAPASASSGAAERTASTPTTSRRYAQARSSISTTAVSKPASSAWMAKIPLPGPISVRRPGRPDMSRDELHAPALRHAPARAGRPGRGARSTRRGSRSPRSAGTFSRCSERQREQRR